MKRRFSIIYWIGIALIVALNFLIWTYLNRTEQGVIYELKSKLRIIGNHISRSIDADYVNILIPGDTSSLNYLTLQTQLENFRRQDSLQTILLSDINGELLVTAPEFISTERQTAFSDNTFFQKALSGETKINDPVNIANEWFITAFIPIKDIDDFTNSILILETKANYFESVVSLKKQFYIFSFINTILILFISIIIFNLTRRILNVETRLREKEHLAQLGTMAAVVAHEIRNPLSIIEGTNDLIQKKFGPADDEVFNFIPGEIKRLNILIEDFLKLSRTPEIKKVKIVLKDFVQRILVTQLNSDISTQINPENISFYCDPNLLEQIILNIVKNALEAGNGVTAKIVVTKRREKIIFEIKDNGPGISPKVLEKIFQPFYTTKEKGTGLGLSITKRLIDLLEGTIIINSSDSGTIVTLKFPSK